MDDATARYVAASLRLHASRLPVPRPMDREDLVQTGLVEAVKAEGRWRPGHGRSLRSWMVLRGAHAITDLVRTHGAQMRDGRPRAVEVPLPEDDAPGADPALRAAPSAEAEYFRRWEARETDIAIRRLGERDRRLGYVARYLYEDRGSRRALASHLGVSAPRVSQLVAQARRHLAPIRAAVG
jgi:RNA polymerase sigma factor (sigma-70 family)